jgi:hypothetical protein
LRAKVLETRKRRRVCQQPTRKFNQFSLGHLFVDYNSELKICSFFSLVSFANIQQQLSSFLRVLVVHGFCRYFPLIPNQITAQPASATLQQRAADWTAKPGRREDMTFACSSWNMVLQVPQMFRIVRTK